MAAQLRGATAHIGLVWLEGKELLATEGRREALNEGEVDDMIDMGDGHAFLLNEDERDAWFDEESEL